MITKNVLLSLAVLALLLPARPADACSCLAQTPAKYREQAHQVLLARAGKIVTIGEHTYQPFEVLAALKGPAVAIWTRVRKAGVTPPCNIEYRPGEVALLHIAHADVDLCAGNYALSSQMDRLHQSLAAGQQGAASPSPGQAAFQAGLSAVLRGYLHERPSVPIQHAALAGKQLAIGDSKLPFVAKKAGEKQDDVVIQQAISRGKVHLIGGTYGAEGLVFQVLLHEKDGKFEVLQQSVAERS